MTPGSPPLYFPWDPVNHLLCCLKWCDSFQAIFCPVSAQWLIPGGGGGAFPHLLNVMNHNTALGRNSTLALLEMSVSQTVRTEQSGGLLVGEAAQVCKAYFKTIICIYLDGDDNAGLCHPAPFAFLGRRVGIKCGLKSTFASKQT